MDANQLAEAAARAVEIARPAQEYCLLNVDHWATCMTKAEWSGWMQAIGAVAALVIAMSLPYLQERGRKLRIFETAKHAVLHQLGSLHAVRVKGAQVTMRSALGLSLPTFQTGTRLFDEVEISLLPVALWPCWQGAVTTAAQLKEMAANAVGTYGSDAGILKLVDEIVSQTEQQLYELMAEDPRWWKRRRKGR